MSCPTPTDVAIKFIGGNRFFKVTWTYPAGQAVEFLVDIRAEVQPDMWEVVETSWAFQSARVCRLRVPLKRSGERYFACVTAVCKDCSNSDAGTSEIIVYP